MTTLLLTAALFAGGVPSGPQVGDKLGDFKAHAFSGPDAGKEVKLHEKAKDGPLMLVFVHEITRPGFQLLKPLDKFASENEKLKTYIVWLSPEKEKAEEFLKRAQNSLNLQSPVLISLDGKDGPPAYGLNDQVKMTVLIARDNRVVSNFALVDPNQTDARKVIMAAQKALEK